ncbi:methyltransferase domain-containing protein [Candidatus Uhrbacteria bacterium]|nr:methyltransferase domain-containing protein [Candidatus Uhrbacteria bacterium]
MIILDAVTITLIVLVFLTGALFFLFVLQPLGLPFVPSRDSTVKEIFSLLGDIKGKKVLDLGSGNGKIVIAAARAGAHAVGFEINPLLVKISRNRIARIGVSSHARIERADFWSTDLSEYDIIVFYGVVPAMKRLEEKLEEELKPGARVVTSYCEFYGWKPRIQKGNVSIYEKSDDEPISKDHF